jgi:aminopeptidase N
VHSAALARLASAEPQSDVQLAAMRATIDSSENVDLLRSWVRGEDVPKGVTVDLELRWEMLTRLACLDGVTRPELEAWLARETTTQAKVHLVRCLSSLPDEAAKQYAWERFTGAVPASPYEIEAAGRGLWQPGQEQVTQPYLDRYFAEVAGTVELRSGFLLSQAARVFFPWTAISRSTLDVGEQVLDDQALDPGLRRTLVDRNDDLRRDVVARETFGPGGQAEQGG